MVRFFRHGSAARSTAAALAVSLVVAGALVIALRAVPAQSAEDVWVYEGDDDDVAVSQLATFMEEHGMDVSAEEGYVFLQGELLKILLEPKMYKDKLDRIVVLVMFGVQEEAKDAKGALLEFVNGLNRDYNVGAFYMDSDYDMVFMTQITFVDELAWRELKEAMDFVKASLAVILSRKPAGRYLR